MKSIILVAILCIAIAAASISEETVLPEDAELISDLILDIEGFEPLVNIGVDDSCLVIFIATGREWTDSEEDWDELAAILAIVSGVDYERIWMARDVAVSYKDIWFSVTMQSLFDLTDNIEILTEDEWWQEFKNTVEIHQRTSPADDEGGL